MQDPKLWYVNVFVTDLDRAIDFYGSILGLKLRHADREHGYASFHAGHVSLGLASVVSSSADSTTLVGRHAAVGLGVPDLEAAYAQLREAGVRFTMPPEKQPWADSWPHSATPTATCSISTSSGRSREGRSAVLR